jgi:hypothetical protein
MKTDLDAAGNRNQINGPLLCFYADRVLPDFFQVPVSRKLVLIIFQSPLELSKK